MARYTTTAGQLFTVSLLDDYADNGWTVSDTFATHEGCNPGYIKNSLPLIVVGKTYVITYRVSGYASGIIRAELGSTIGTNNSSNGTFTDTLLCSDTNQLRFYADGAVTVEFVSIYEQGVGDIDNSLTLAFNEKENRWEMYCSFKPEFMMRYIDSFFTFKDGKLWVQNSNELRNNFYGVQYPSEIVFYVNINPTAIKQFFSMRQISNKCWTVTDITIPPVEGKKDGMKSRLKKGRFSTYNGEFYADLLKNMIDPRFTDQLKALFNGADLQGRYMKVTVEITEPEKVLLLSMDFKTANQNITY